MRCPLCCRHCNLHALHCNLLALHCNLHALRSTHFCALACINGAVALAIARFCKNICSGNAKWKCKTSPKPPKGAWQQQPSCHSDIESSCPPAICKEGSCRLRRHVAQGSIHQHTSRKPQCRHQLTKQSGSRCSVLMLVLPSHTCTVMLAGAMCSNEMHHSKTSIKPNAPSLK